MTKATNPKKSRMRVPALSWKLTGGLTVCLHSPLAIADDSRRCSGLTTMTTTTTTTTTTQTHNVTSAQLSQTIKSAMRDGSLLRRIPLNRSREV